MTPAPAAAAGTPAEGDEDDVAKATEDSTITITQDALESLITKSVAAALGTQPPAEDVAIRAPIKHDAYVTVTAAKDLDAWVVRAREKGIVWCEHVFFARRLAQNKPRPKRPKTPTSTFR